MYQLIVILCRYLFVFYAAYFLWQGVAYILSERAIVNFDRRAAVLKQRLTVAFLHVTAFLLLAYRPDTWFDPRTLAAGGIGLVLLLLLPFLAGRVYRESCPLVWNGALFLLDVSVIALERLKPLLAERQLMFIAGGFAALLLIPLFFKLIPRFEKLELAYLIIGFLALLLPFLGERLLGALNWVAVGDFSFQPSEVVKFLYVFYLASVFRKSLRLRQILFPMAASGVMVCVLVLQMDLGAALIFFMTFLVVLYISTGRTALTLAGVAALAAAAVGANRLFPHVQTRVAAWLNPWAIIDSGGYQITQSLFAIGTWGVWGSGLGRGSPADIPVVTTDFIFSAVCEEFGLLFALGLIGVFIMIFYRGVHISLRSRRKYYGLLAAGFTGMLAFQTFLIIGGVIKLIPMTGVTLPLVSYGGSSVVVCLLMVGILQWIYMHDSKTTEMTQVYTPITAGQEAETGP